MHIFNKIITIILISSYILLAQNNIPRLSPKSIVGQTIGYTDVQITYGSPGVKEREIWGDLVPYNKVWRAGANEATTIEFSNDVILNGHLVPANKYSLFIIPSETEWIIILNKIYDQWGAFKYISEEDLIRFSVMPKANSFVERLKYSIEYKSPYVSDVIMEWEKLKIYFSIEAKSKRKI